MIKKGGIMGIFNGFKFLALVGVALITGCDLMTPQGVGINQKLAGKVGVRDAGAPTPIVPVKPVQSDSKPESDDSREPKKPAPTPAPTQKPIVVVAPIEYLAPMPIVISTPKPMVVSTPAPSPSVAPVASSSLSRADVLKMSDNEIYARLISGGIGECYVYESRPSCPSCFCDAYFKSKLVAWGGKGWPVNPASGDSTGCISNIQWGGYTPAMATQNMKANAVAQARDAFAHPSNPCGLKDTMPSAGDEDADAVPVKKDARCPSQFGGHPFTGSYDYSGAFHVCDYAGSVSNQECSALGAMFTAGPHGVWCQKFTDPSRSVLLSLARSQ
jgi:hypothetical protein